MITQEPTVEMIETWQAVWKKYRDVIHPNRKSGAEILAYLQKRYPLTERFDSRAMEVISENVYRNEYFKEKLPMGTSTEPRAFTLENTGNGQRFYAESNKDEEI